MNEPTPHEILETMLRYGGSFAKAIANAAFKADLDNRRRLEAAFPDLWQHYTEMARQNQPDCSREA